MSDLGSKGGMQTENGEKIQYLLLGKERTSKAAAL